MKRMIKQYIIRMLIQNMDKSLLFYFVNGTPEKRLFRIRELASHIYNTMTTVERETLYEKLRGEKPPM